MLADTSSNGYSLLSSYSKSSVYGSIAIVGAPQDVITITEQLLTEDRRDNVSGNLSADGLPDFAGETVSMMADAANAPYSSFVASDDLLSLREATVRNFLSAMDTLSYTSPYDTEHSVAKAKAKAVILASSLSSMYGYEDIRALCSGIGSEVPVFSRLHSMADYAITQAPQSEPVFLVWPDSSLSEGGVYRNVISDCAAARQTSAPVCRISQPVEYGSLDERLYEFLDYYIAAGGEERISAILLDDNSVNPDSLAQAVRRLKSTTDDNLLAYKNIMDPDCVLVWPSLALARDCYLYLRKVNGFTHRVAYPAMKGYVTVSAPSESAAPYFFVEMRNRYAGEKILSYMEERAPKTYSLYVR